MSTLEELESRLLALETRLQQCGRDVGGAFWTGNGQLRSRYGICLGVERAGLGLYYLHTSEPLLRTRHIVLFNHVGANLPTFPRVEARLVLYNEFATPEQQPDGSYVQCVEVTDDGAPFDAGVGLVVFRPWEDP